MAALDTLLTNMDASCIPDLATYQRAAWSIGAPHAKSMLVLGCAQHPAAPSWHSQHLLVSLQALQKRAQEGQEQLLYNQEQVVALQNQSEKLLAEKLEVQKEDAAAYNALATE